MRRLSRALALLLVAAACAPPAPPRPPLGQVPDFRLLERSGQAVTRGDLLGRPWVADFIFTSCAGVCPAMTARMARLRREAPAGQVRFVSFTVDPARDTPEVLARYAAKAGAGPDWLFVTGPQKDLHALATAGFKLAAMEVPLGQEQGADGPFLHSGKFVLVDREGAIRGYYDSDDEEEMGALARDLPRMAGEP